MTTDNDGPYYEDMEPGMVFPSPPALLVDSGMASTYQTIVLDFYFIFQLVLAQSLHNKL